MSTTTTRTLKMIFATEEGGEYTFSLKDCKPDISGDVVMQKMDDMISAQPFDVDLASRKSAKVVVRTVEETILF